MMEDLLDGLMSIARAMAPSRPPALGQLIEYLAAGRELYASGRTHAEVIAVLRQIAADPPGAADPHSGDADIDARIAAKFPQSEPPRAPSDVGHLPAGADTGEEDGA